MGRDEELIKGAFGLGAYALRRREPIITGELPKVDELYDALDEIHGTTKEPDTAEEAEEEASSRAHAKAEGTACIPCSNDHLSTCSGLLAEALRFAHEDGIESEEVVSRIGLCRDELNAMERVDLRPEVTMTLPAWEKDIASHALTGSRDIRHNMEKITDADGLEKVAGKTQALRKDIGVRWVKGKIANLSPEEKEKVKQRTKEVMDEELGL